MIKLLPCVFGGLSGLLFYTAGLEICIFCILLGSTGDPNLKKFSSTSKNEEASIENVHIWSAG